jgi:DNA-binding MarR family transcriptional regulator
VNAIERSFCVSSTLRRVWSCSLFTAPFSDSADHASRFASRSALPRRRRIDNTLPDAYLTQAQGRSHRRGEKVVTNDDIRTLAGLRLVLRQFQSFSEHAAEARGLTTQQYQALLAIKGEHSDAPITVTLLAQRLLIKHNSAVGLVDRMEELGLVARRPSERDRRSVIVQITARGESVFKRLAIAHRRELQRIAPELGRHVRQLAKPGEAG